MEVVLVGRNEDSLEDVAVVINANVVGDEDKIGMDQMAQEGLQEYVVVDNT